MPIFNQLNIVLRPAFFLLCIVLVGACSSIDDEEEGPAPLRDFDETVSFEKEWSTSVGDGQGGIYNRITPAIDGDIIYVAAANGELEAIALEDGDSIWDRDLDLELNGGVGVGPDLLVLSTPDGDIIALDKSNGEERWRVNIAAEVLSAAVIDDSRVYVQTVDAQMLAFNNTDGSRAWSFRNTIPVLTLRGTSSPILHQNILMAGFANGSVIGFDTVTGSIHWEVRVAIPKGNSEIERIVDIDGELLLDNKVVYAVSYQGRVAAIDPVSGRRLWASEASSHVSMDQGFGNLYIVGGDGSVTAFIKNGQGIRWAQTVFSKRQLTAPTTMGEYVIVGDFEGYLHALSQADGHVVGRRRVDSDGLRVDFLSYNDKLIVYSNGGKLVAYTLELEE